MQFLEELEIRQFAFMAQDNTLTSPWVVKPKHCHHQKRISICGGSFGNITAYIIFELKKKQNYNQHNITFEEESSLIILIAFYVNPY